MKEGLKQIIGKTIKAVLVNQERGQLYLIFTDDTHFELYGWPQKHVNWARAVDRGGIDKAIMPGEEKNTVVIRDIEPLSDNSKESSTDNQNTGSVTHYKIRLPSLDGIPPGSKLISIKLPDGTVFGEPDE
jgi:hypothetical protein